MPVHLCTPGTFFDSTDFIRNASQANLQVPVPGAVRTIADLIWLRSEPNSKSQLAQCLVHMYEYQAIRAGPLLPDLDEFLRVLSRPDWVWTPQASGLFRRIGLILQTSGSRWRRFRRPDPTEGMERRTMQTWQAAIRRRYRGGN